MSGIRAGDLTPGLYEAHGSGIPDCEIYQVLHLHGIRQVTITYDYPPGEKQRDSFSVESEWHVKRHVPELVIQEWL